MAWLALAGVVMAGAWWATRRHEGASSAAHRIAMMDPARAYQIALVLGGQGEHFASLPYFRRALADPAGGWQARRNYAAALNNATFEVWSRGGRVSPASRSSVERVDMALTSLDVRRAAESSAPPSLRAALLVEDGGNYESWGMPYDALAAYLEAVRADSTSAAARAAVQRLMTGH